MPLITSAVTLPTAGNFRCATRQCLSIAAAELLDEF